VLVACLIVLLLVSIVVWVAITAPNVPPQPPHRRQKDLWG